MRIALAVSLLALVACAPRPSVEPAAAAPYEWTPIPAPPPPLTVPVSLFEVTYSTAGGELHRRVVDVATLATIADVSLGRSQAFRAIAGTSSAFVDDPAGDVSVVNARGERVRFSGPVSPLPVGTASSSGLVYFGDRETIALGDADGHVLRSFAAPQATPGVPVLPAYYKGPLRADSSAVAAFLVSDAATFVVVSGVANSAIVDLDGGGRLELTGVAPVLDLVRDGDRAFLLGIDTTALDRPFVLAEVDLATLDLVALRRFSVDRPARSLNGARLLATQRGDVYAYFAVPLVDAGVPMRSELVGFDATLAPSRVPLPNDLGLDAVVGADGAVYVFGGVGANVVSRVDPLTGALSRYAVAPNGAYVRALAAR